MKIRDLILSVLIVGMVISTGVLVFFASNGINDVKNTTSEASSGELLSNAGNNLQDLAVSIRDSLDSQMKNQYTMVKMWAKEPSLLDAARKAKSYSEEELFEMWSAAATRTFFVTNAIGDGNPDNDLSPAVSKYIMELSANTNYPQIIVTDYQGQTIAANAATKVFSHGPVICTVNTAGEFEKTESASGGKDWYRATLASTSGFYVSDVIWESDIQKWGIIIACQLIDPDTGEYLGQLKAVFNYVTFIDELLNAEKLGVYEIKVVNESGIVIATSLEDKDKVNNIMVHVFEIPAIRENVFKGVGYVPESFVDENKEEVYLGFAKSEDQWHVIMVSKKAGAVEAPVGLFVTGLQSDIGDKSSALQRNMIIIGVAVAVVIILLAALIMRAKVSVPLSKLSAISDKLAKGEIEGLEIDVKGKDEISKFGEHFKGVLAAFEFLKDEAEKKQ